MKKEIRTEILINSNPAKVWEILTNFDNYPNWNPFIKSINGNVVAGKKIKVRITPPESKGMTFKPKVLAFEPQKEILWIGKLILPGVFDGEHKFEIIDNRNGTVTFRQSEKFNGILVGLLNLENTKNGFETMNKKLKEMAEQR